MLDSAIEDTGEDGLINFDKKRKEFEILAQIRLLQSAAQTYRIKPDRGFFEWFYSIRLYDDKESYDLSCSIEPYVPSTPKEKGHKKKPSFGFFTPKPASSNSQDDSNDVTTNDADDAKSLCSNPETSTPSSNIRPAVSARLHSNCCMLLKIV